jgi:hypothetical protein
MFRLANILQRIPGDRNDVSRLAGFQRTDFVGESQQLGINRRSGSQRVDRLHTQIRHLMKLFGIAAVRINRRIGAQSDFNILS